MPPLLNLARQPGVAGGQFTGALDNESLLLGVYAGDRTQMAPGEDEKVMKEPGSKRKRGQKQAHDPQALGVAQHQQRLGRHRHRDAATNFTDLEVFFHMTLQTGFGRAQRRHVTMNRAVLVTRQHQHLRHALLKRAQGLGLPRIRCIGWSHWPEAGDVQAQTLHLLRQLGNLPRHASVIDQGQGLPVRGQHIAMRMAQIGVGLGFRRDRDVHPAMARVPLARHLDQPEQRGSTLACGRHRRPIDAQGLDPQQPATQERSHHIHEHHTASMTGIAMARHDVGLRGGEHACILSKVSATELRMQRALR